MRILKLWIVALATVAVLAACGRDAATAPDEEAQALQIYEVPPAQLQSVERALREVLAPNDIGSVSNSDGRLVVLAPAGTQASIAKAIEALSSQPVEGGTASDAPIHLRFWLLEGSTDEGPADPRLEPLKPALDAASTGLGLQGYRLQGFTDVLTTPGKRFTSATSNLLVRGGANLSGAGVTLDIDMNMKQHDNDWSAEIQTGVLLEPGQFLVLGTSAAADGSMRLIVAQAQLSADES